MTYTGVAKGKIIELDEPLPYREGEIIRVSIEPLGPKAQPGSPAAVLAAMRALPDIDPADVECLERAIEHGRLPVSSASVFDDEPTEHQV